MPFPEDLPEHSVSSTLNIMQDMFHCLSFTISEGYYYSLQFRDDETGSQ